MPELKLKLKSTQGLRLDLALLLCCYATRSNSTISLIGFVWRLLFALVCFSLLDSLAYDSVNNNTLFKI